MQRELTSGSVTGAMLRFALPMILGNLLQQLYNIADTIVVGRALGADALAAVGSAYTLMTFLTSILLGLCLGSGAFFSMCFGARDEERLRGGVFAAFVLIGAAAVLINAAVYALTDPILRFLRTPQAVYGLMRDYVTVVFAGILATFLYNFFASLLRAVGNSTVPLLFLAVSALLNVGLDLLLVLVIPWGVRGAALATVLAQWVAGAGLTAYALARFPALRPARRHMRLRRSVVRDIVQLSSLTCVQQSVMNFGILMVQGLVNSFGPAVMAAFAAAVKIDSFAYMPVQDFGNAFSTFVAQNYGAGQTERIRRGIRSAATTSTAFCLVVTALVCAFAGPLMRIFVGAGEEEIVAIGVGYLRIEGAFYCGIGWLFLLYGLYRAVKRPGMSVVLTAISLGTRVALAYLLSAIPAVGVAGIWAAVPIGWLLADATGVGYYLRRRARLIGPDAA